MVDSNGCQPDEIILRRFTEYEFRNSSKNFVHVQWRSLSEVFDYLGAILRYNDRQQAEGKDPLSLREVDDPTIASDDLGFEKSGQKFKKTIMFGLSRGGNGSLGANYNGQYFAVPDVNSNAPTADYTRPIFGMLNVLVNYAAQPGSISSSAPVCQWRLHPPQIGRLNIPHFNVAARS